eukprot:COSAG06_NODE_249_length_19140_cov_18.998004_13_plen_155_part_00
MDSGAGLIAAGASELHRSREAVSRARGRAPIRGHPRRSTETAPIWGHTCWNPPIWGVAPIWGHSSESAPIWENPLYILSILDTALRSARGGSRRTRAHALGHAAWRPPADLEQGCLRQPAKAELVGPGVLLLKRGLLLRPYAELLIVADQCRRH